MCTCAALQAAPRPDTRTLHQGLPVVKGHKYACNLWVLQHPFETYRGTQR